MSTALTTTRPNSLAAALEAPAIRDTPVQGIADILVQETTLHLGAGKTDPVVFITAAEMLLMKYPLLTVAEIPLAFKYFGLGQTVDVSAYYGAVTPAAIVAIMEGFVQLDARKKAKEAASAPPVMTQEEGLELWKKDCRADLARWQAGTGIPEKWADLNAATCELLIRENPTLFAEFKEAAWQEAKAMTATQMDEAHEGATLFSVWGMEKREWAKRGGSPASACYAKKCVFAYLQTIAAV